MLNPPTIHFGISQPEKVIELVSDDVDVDEDEDLELHFKRRPNSCFVNNYFVVRLEAWQANIETHATLLLISTRQ